MNTLVADILELNVSERLQIVEEIWNSIAADAAEMPLSVGLRDELDRRLDAYQTAPDKGVSFDELKKRLTRSK